MKMSAKFLEKFQRPRLTELCEIKSVSYIYTNCGTSVTQVANCSILDSLTSFQWK